MGCWGTELDDVQPGSRGAGRPRYLTSWPQNADNGLYDTFPAGGGRGGERGFVDGGGGGGGQPVWRVWVYDPASGTPIAETRCDAAGLVSTVGVVADLNGAPRELVDVAAGRVCATAVRTAYGVPVWAGGVSCPLGFAGQYVDAESGWVYNRHRFYDPHAGVYTAPDPVGLSANLATAYGYPAHPWILIDPLGLMSHRANGWLKDNAEKKWHVYRYTNNHGDTTYVGITQHPRLRMLQHALTHPLTRPKDGFTTLTGEVPLGKYEARGVEQYLIEHYGMAERTHPLTGKPIYAPRSGAATNTSAAGTPGTLENKINSLSLSHRHYEQAVSFGKQWAAEHLGF